MPPLAHSPRILHGHHPDVVDMAHVRWAAGTAVTAIDLCAAALARLHCGTTSSREGSISDFRPDPRNQRRRVALPPAALDWLDSVLADASYGAIKLARDPMTHGKLIRTLQIGVTPPGPHEQRTLFPVAVSPQGMAARDVILLAVDVGVRHVASFVDGVIAREFWAPPV